MATQDEDQALERLKNMPIRSEEIGFSPDELKPCAKCGKPNAPDRAACLYCGNEFEGAVAAKLDTRELEPWEKGFNVVLLETGAADVAAIAAKLSGLLGTEAENLKEILRSDRSIPIARLESQKDAAVVSEKLAAFGVTARVIADEALHAETRPVRLRSITFGQDELHLHPFNPGTDQSLARTDLALIAVGAILEERTESVERRSRRESKTLSEFQLSSDEPVIDIYSRHDPAGWRIPTSGFDFSCLGSHKTLLAAENMKRLVSKLAEFSPAAKVVDDYSDLRPRLEHCWPGESRKDARSVGNRVGRRDVASVVRTSNAGQWTKYSRLQWHLL
jgi:hypothetical protein